MGGVTVRHASRKLQALHSDSEPEVILTDDGGSGLYEACASRFSAPEFLVKCDSRHTVWVRRSDGTRSIGVPPWVLRQQELEEVLAGIEGKLELPVG
jgi:hypothetical protein